jgi:polysaccharide export outer membrane protein
MKLLMAVVAFLVPTFASPQISTGPAEFSAYRPTDMPTSLEGGDYIIGRDDLLEVAVFEIPELSGSARVTASGTLALNYIGVVNAAGKTQQELARLIESTLKGKQINDPHVTVFVREYASQPVSVLGAVRVPGIYQIKGQKTLLDILAMAQGLNESAGDTIQIVRRKAEAPNQTDGKVASTAEPRTITINVVDLVQKGNAALNIPILAGDVVNVLNTGSIFAVGEFTRPGEYPLRYGRAVTVTQAVALGGGATREGLKKKCLIIRPHADGSKEQIPINLEKILEGANDDVPLLANDVLFIPANKTKTGITRALDSALAIAVGRAIYMGH